MNPTTNRPRFLAYDRADRAHFYRIAAGSAAEVRGVLDAAEAFGFVNASEIAAASDRFGQVVAMLRPLTR